MKSTKVSNVESHEGSFVHRGKLILIKQAHGNFSVPKSDIYYCDFINRYHNGKVNPMGNDISVQQDCCYAVKPIIISETERIKKGELVFQTITNEIIKAPFNCNPENDERYRKILALPENFSPKSIQAIIYLEFKNNDNVLIRCYPNMDGAGQDGWRIDFNTEGVFERKEMPYIELFRIKNQESWDDVKSKLYVGEKEEDDSIDFMINSLINLGYNPPILKNK